LPFGNSWFGNTPKGFLKPPNWANAFNTSSQNASGFKGDHPGVISLLGKWAAQRGLLSEKFHFVGENTSLHLFFKSEQFFYTGGLISVSPKVSLLRTFRGGHL